MCNPITPYRKKNLSYYLFLVLYYSFATYLPDSYTPIIGKIGNWLRIICVKKIFYKCGKLTTFNRRVHFGNGLYVQ